MNKNISLIKVILMATGIGLMSIVFPFAYIFFPYLFIAESFKDGIIKPIVALVITSIILGLIASSAITGIMFIVVSIPFILIYEYLLKENTNVYIIFLSTSTILIISLIIFLNSIGINYEFLTSKEYIDTLLKIKEQLFMNNDFGVSNQKFIQMYLENLEISSSVLFIYSLLVSYVTYLLVQKNLIKEKINEIKNIYFSQLRIPLGFIFIISVILVINNFFGNYFWDIQKIVSYNLMIILLILLMIQGLSVVKYFLLKYNVNKIIRMILLIFLVIILPLQYLLSIIGLIDELLNVRKLS